MAKHFKVRAATVFTGAAQKNPSDDANSDLHTRLQRPKQTTSTWTV